MVVPTTSSLGTICTSRTSYRILWPRHDDVHCAVACSCVKEKEVFETLVGEALDKASGKSDPYNTPGTLEYEAQQVQINAISIQQKGGI